LKLVVIIATAGRAELVGQLLRHLETQTRPPDEVVLAAPDASHLDAYPPQRFAVSCVFGRLGLTAQRNLALELAIARSDVITFFDDDFLPASDYLERVQQAFAANPQWSVLFGHAVHDGATTPGLTFSEGLLKLRVAEEARSPQHASQAYDHLGAYGCNMSVRSRHIGSIRFDERLVLYGWQEDIDFTNQLRRCGRVVALSTLLGVHLGVKAGRVSGIRFGYSQVVNPVYLIRKGTMPARFAIELMTRNLAANLVRSLWPEAHVDRVGRLKGNLLAAYHLLKGKVEPEYILKL
jgi:glycosyltransferase involved in cell wall biosynthesis